MDFFLCEVYYTSISGWKVQRKGQSNCEWNYYFLIFLHLNNFCTSIMAFTRWWISLQLDSLARTCKLVVSFFDKFSVFINELWVAFLIFSLVTVKPNLCVTTDVFARLRHQRQKPFIAFDVNIPGAGNIFIDWNIKKKRPEAILTCLESYVYNPTYWFIPLMYYIIIHYYAYESRGSTPALASCWICSQLSGAPNENIVQNHLNIALLNVF